jgi:hypothetical protein
MTDGFADACRLVLTFAWEEPDPDDQETLVVLSFDSAAGGTNLVLDQQPFRRNSAAGSITMAGRTRSTGWHVSSARCAFLRASQRPTR